MNRDPDYEVYYVKSTIWIPKETWHPVRNRREIRKFVGKIIFFTGCAANSTAIFESRDGTVLCLPGDAIIAVVPVDTED